MACAEKENLLPNWHLSDVLLNLDLFFSVLETCNVYKLQQ